MGQALALISHGARRPVAAAAAACWRQRRQQRRQQQQQQGRSRAALIMVRMLALALALLLPVVASTTGGDGKPPSCAAVLMAACPHHHHGERIGSSSVGSSSRAVMQCDACAGQHQQILKRANCAAEEVQAWCAWGVDPCCKEVAHADCWGFTPGADATASIQAAIDCPLAHTVVVKNMGSPWIVGLPPLRLPVTFSPLSGGVIRAAINFSTSNQLIVFQPGSVVEAKRWSFHGFKDAISVIGSEWGPVRNLTIQGEGAVWRMWKEDYQCFPCQPVPFGGEPCTTCQKCDPKSKLYNQTQCYAKSEWRLV